MFGLSFGEILLLLIVGIVVVGPKNLPPLMRTAGKWVAKLRRMSFDLRAQSGIDDLIREEGLEREIHELRSLSRGGVLDTLMAPPMAPPMASVPRSRARSAPMPEPLREREYPAGGCDSYGALPDDAAPYRPPPPEHDAEEPAERTESEERASATKAETDSSDHSKDAAE